jgi:hypothetical protein
MEHYIVTDFKKDEVIGAGFSSDDHMVTVFEHWEDYFDESLYIFGSGFDAGFANIMSVSEDPQNYHLWLNPPADTVNLFVDDDVIALAGSQMPSMFKDDDGHYAVFGIAQMDEYSGLPSGDTVLYAGKTKIIVNNQGRETGFVPGLTGHGVKPGDTVRFFDNPGFANELNFEILYAFDQGDITPDYIVIDRDAPANPSHDGWVRIYR